MNAISSLVDEVLSGLLSTRAAPAHSQTTQGHGAQGELVSFSWGGQVKSSGVIDAELVYRTEGAGACHEQIFQKNM